MINTNGKRHIGIISSSNGGVFCELVSILETVFPTQYRFSVVTDRECGIESFCESQTIPWTRITAKSSQDFSRQAYDFFSQQGHVNWIQLYVLRRITKDLFQTVPTFNTHPSLLPVFPGLNALEQTLTSGARFFGCTLHLVDETLDTGPIISQFSSPLHPSITMPELEKRSFLQKVYLALVLVELFENDQLQFANDFSGVQLLSQNAVKSYANPALTHTGLLAAFDDLQQREGVWITL